jgi:hypothetical protein
MYHAMELIPVVLVASVFSGPTTAQVEGICVSRDEWGTSGQQNYLWAYLAQGMCTSNNSAHTVLILVSKSLVYIEL